MSRIAVVNFNHLHQTRNRSVNRGITSHKNGRKERWKGENAKNVKPIQTRVFVLFSPSIRPKSFFSSPNQVMYSFGYVYTHESANNTIKQTFYLNISTCSNFLSFWSTFLCNTWQGIEYYCVKHMSTVNKDDDVKK